MRGALPLTKGASAIRATGIGAATVWQFWTGTQRERRVSGDECQEQSQGTSSTGPGHCRGCQHSYLLSSPGHGVTIMSGQAQR